MVHDYNWHYAKMGLMDKNMDPRWSTFLILGWGSYNQNYEILTYYEIDYSYEMPHSNICG